jgi:hypothetical protein
VKDDRALLLLSASLVIFVLSLLLPAFSVHIYCENRTGAAIFGVISITISLALFRNRARINRKKDRVRRGSGPIDFCDCREPGFYPLRDP